MHEDKMGFPLGRPATDGSGEPRFTLRVPLWLGLNTRITELSNLAEGETYETQIDGKQVSIENRGAYFLLRLMGYDSEEAAKKAWGTLRLALLRLSAESGTGLQFQNTLGKIVRKGDPEFSWCENLNPEVYPEQWKVRPDGSRTDGGVAPLCPCIVPEHERIWEFNILLGYQEWTIGLSQIGTFVESSMRYAAEIAEDPRLQMAAQALWISNSSYDGRNKYLLLVTALDTLAANEILEDRGPIPAVEEVANWLEARTAGSPPEERALLRQLRDYIRRFGKAGDKARFSHLVDRVGGNGGETWKKRSQIVHGGKFSEIPTAQDCEELRKVVTAAFEVKMGELTKDSEISGS